MTGVDPTDPNMVGTSKWNDAHTNPAISDVTGLQTALDAKAALNHVHAGMGTVIASGTATFATSALTTGSQSAAATISGTMTGIQATDAVSWAYTTLPPAATSARLIVNPVVGANSISFTRTNPTAASITPTAMVLNWKVVR
jgi:hypothetical protein